jgi:uncharacterized protein involved in exopolysaccharide biosynthesis
VNTHDLRTELLVRDGEVQALETLLAEARAENAQLRAAILRAAPNRAGETARRTDALKAEIEALRARIRDLENTRSAAFLLRRRAEADNERLRTAAGEALTTMKDPNRSNAEIVVEVHAILSRVMAD